MKLKEIASIQTGLFAKPLAMGEVVYLQSKHFDDQGTLLAALHPDLLLADISLRHLLQPGDVLFAAKGTKNVAAVYEEHYPKAVASTSFFVIRLSNPDVLPDYLAWFLNNPATQAALKAQAMGTSIPSISKQVLEEVDVPIPSFEIQTIVVSISRLRIVEKTILGRLESLRDKQIQYQLINSIYL